MVNGISMPADVHRTNVRLLYISDNSHHLSQVFTGFKRLHDQGLIKLAQERVAGERLDALANNDKWLVFAQVEDKLACYDVRDGCGINRSVLPEVDVYFKRSYDPRSIEQDVERAFHDSIFPLGLNYAVYDDRPDFFAVRRAISIQGLRGLGTIARPLRWGSAYSPRLSYLESAPSLNCDDKVLFFTRLWDPARVNTASNIEQRSLINEMRIETVRLLKKEFGKRFVGGLQPSEFTERICTKDLMSDRRLTKKRYLRLMKTIPICITTMGLHESNGWKLGEYVACSKAILTEPLLHTVPGRFGEGTNYLVFRSPQECVEKAVVLMQNRAYRHEIMLNNFRYYMGFLRPELLVLNSIVKTLAA